VFAKIARVTKGCLWKLSCLNTHFRGRRELPKGNAVNPLMLFIDQRAPRGGEDAGSRQMLSYLKLFAGRGYRIVFWSYEGNDDPKAVQELKKLGIQVLHRVPYSFGFQDWIRAFGHDLKVAFLSRPHVAVGFLNAIKKRSGATMVYYGHDLHVERMNLQNIMVPGSFADETVSSVRKMEEECWEKSDVILYPSIDEVNLLREKYPHRRINVLPIECLADAEINEIVTPNGSGERKGLLFVGGFSHLPNRDAVLWFLNEVYPLIEEKIPNLKITIAGNAPTDEIKSKSSKQVVITGRVSEEELHSLYNRAKVIVAPLRIGAGVKGKVVEALRMGVTIVTTSIGVQGLPGYEEAIAVADDPTDFAKAVLNLLQDDALWQRRRDAGLKYYRENFSESVVAHKVLALLNGDS
jgi:glycosyltransferase involved in cell wall biosynthesis